jgi:hypothetical protein
MWTFSRLTVRWHAIPKPTAPDAMCREDIAGIATPTGCRIRKDITGGTYRK